ncbi:MAG: ABC transporter ATP-binding protein [Candidatus Obscuribacterales bacterium]|jgi:ABC-2 type transport system ATP-binding protein|nr:ABC transporter ATP-binding protein [Candidatus Obscuribacterales bacterium]
MTDTVIRVEGLVKDHFSHFLRKRFRALDGVNLTVQKGEAFGLLGPNGAGKTTTQKLLLGLIKPTAGSITVLGKAAGEKSALQRIGFLPENPYFYAYLTAQEFLDFFAQLFDLSGKVKADRIKELLELVSLTEAKDRPIRKFSKGMMQRLGVAQALINDPDLVFFDEPNSGLDPIGRRDIRQIMLLLKKQGKTIFFNSHMLPDVKEICDRVGILHRGKMIGENRISEICKSGSYQELEDYFMNMISNAEDEYRKTGSVTPYHIEREAQTGPR